MEWFYDLAKLVAAGGIIGGGVVAVGKTKFLTKGEFKERKDTCQREMIDRIGALHDDQKDTASKQVKDMGDLREFMGEVKTYMKMKNGGKNA